MRFSAWIISGAVAALRHIDLSDLRFSRSHLQAHSAEESVAERKWDFIAHTSAPARRPNKRSERHDPEVAHGKSPAKSATTRVWEIPQWQMISQPRRQRDEATSTEYFTSADTDQNSLSTTQAAVFSAEEVESERSGGDDVVLAPARLPDEGKSNATRQPEVLVSQLMLEDDTLTETPIDWFGLTWNALHADQVWLDKNLTRVQHMRQPRCEDLGYVNFVYRSTSSAMRHSLRHSVLHQLAREIKFDYDRGHLDPVYSWLTKNFVIPNIPASKDALPPLVQIVFPVGRPCVDDTPECEAELRHLKEEADNYHDILLGDYPDTSEFQGLKFAGVLDYFDSCRAQSNWQWLTRVEPQIVVNVPNVLYYARRQDLLHARAFGDQMPLDSKKLRAEYSVPPPAVKWWVGHVLTEVEVMHEPIDHPNAEAYYHQETYPPYTSKRFHLTHRRFVRELAHRYKKRDTFYRNEDSMLGILVQDMNNEYGSHFKPYNCPGVDIHNTPETLRLLCGRKYKGPQDEDAPARAKEISTLLDCDCRSWLSYPAVDPEDRRKVLRDLRRRCTFKDYYFSKAVSWL